MPPINQSAPPLSFVPSVFATRNTDRARSLVEGYRDTFMRSLPFWVRPAASIAWGPIVAWLVPLLLKIGLELFGVEADADPRLKFQIVDEIRAS